MRNLFLVVAFVTTQLSVAQTYQESLDLCTRSFGDVMAHPENGDDAIIKALGDLKACVVGKEFPEFSATTITGKKITHADLKNNVVFINLWYLSCPPCVAEMPILNELVKDFKGKDFLMLSFSTDDKKSLQEFMSARKINYAVVENSKKLIDDTFRMKFGYPTNLILDKSGKIVEFKTGGPMEEAGLKHAKLEFKAIIERELAK